MTTNTVAGPFDLGSIPVWIQALAAIVSAVVVVVLARMTRDYVQATNRMVGLMEAEREERRLALSREAAGRLAAGFLRARHASEQQIWGYKHLYLPLQSAIHADRDLVGEASLRMRIDTANAMLEGLSQVEKSSGRDAYGDEVREMNPLARARTIEAFKAVIDDLNAHRRGDPLPPTRLPSLSRVVDWLGAHESSAVGEFQGD